MEKRKKSSERVRPIDLRPGDLIRTKLYPNGVVVVDSQLVEPGTYKVGRLRKPEWWVRTLWTDQAGRVQSQTERFKTGKFDEKCVERLFRDLPDETGIPEPT